jgi:hypothetical protein
MPGWVGAGVTTPLPGRVVVVVVDDRVVVDGRVVVGDNVVVVVGDVVVVSCRESITSCIVTLRWDWERLSGEAVDG